MLETIPEAGFVIGADLGGTHILAAVADLHGRLLHVAEVQQSNELPVLDALNSVIHQAIDYLGHEEQGRILGIGVGTPGLLDYASGRVITAANLGWKDLPLRDLLAEKFNLPVFVDNDANVAALAEWSQGAGRGSTHLVYLTVSRGLGAGIIINGQIYPGMGGTAGEIGDTFLRESADAEHGWQTLEDLCSGRALVAQAKAALARGEGFSSGKNQPQLLSLDDILEAARAGNDLAVRLVQRASGYLGVGIANIANMLDPELIIVGGTLAQAGDHVLLPIQATLDRLLSPVIRKKVRVTLGVLGEQAGVIGAASLVIHQAFTPPLRHSEAVSLLPM